VDAELEPNGKRSAKRITKVYKETNKEREEWSSNSTLKGCKTKESNNDYHSNNLKLLLATTFIQYCWRQLLVRKELLRLKQEANEMAT
jgi:hypothetical protein